MKQLWAILPVKPFGEGKSRLAERLHAAERGALSKELMTKVIQTVQEANACAEILVISRDASVLGYAKSVACLPLLEKPALPNQDSLNAALRQAADEAVANGANAILILPADLPLINPQDIVSLAKAGQRGPRVVIAPSTDKGTNALLLNPPDAIDFAFGLRSFERHRKLAEENNVPLHIIHSNTLAFDVDRPADLDALARFAPA